MKPYMRDDESRAIGKLLTRRKPRRVLEFGSGGSTVRFPLGCPTIQQWVSIEHDPGWAARVCEALAQHDCRTVDLYLIQVVRGDASRYVLLPKRLGQKYDLVFVDGIARVECLLAAPALLARGGAVLLHDAVREQYRPGLAPYRRRTALTEGAGGHQGLMLLKM